MDTQSTQAPQTAQVIGWFTTLSRGVKVVLIAAAVGLLSSILNWYSASASYGGISYGGSINGWHGWGYVAILGFAVGAALTMLVVRGGSVRNLAPSLPSVVTDARLVAGAGAVSALAVIIFMLTEGSSVSAPGFSEGPSFGAYLGLLCGIALTIGGYLLDQERKYI
ncbi:MAG TPA: hypothetical protein VNL71_15810 [Chloroflexota bacterium]|nr:hypothetical protein [Chloroflexota bacterium]